MGKVPHLLSTAAACAARAGIAGGASGNATATPTRAECTQLKRDLDAQASAGDKQAGVRVQPTRDACDRAYGPDKGTPPVGALPTHKQHQVGTGSKAG